MEPHSSDRDSVDLPSPNQTPSQPPLPGMVKFPKVVAFGDLCHCGDEVWIENDGQIYRLRRTKLGKLILTK